MIVNNIIELIDLGEPVDVAISLGTQQAPTGVDLIEFYKLRPPFQEYQQGQISKEQLEAKVLGP